MWPRSVTSFGDQLGFESAHPGPAAVLPQLDVRVGGAGGARCARRIGLGGEPDELRETVFHRGEPGLEKSEALDRQLGRVAVVGRGECLRDVGVLQEGCAVGGAGAGPDPVGVLEEVPPVALAAQPLVEVQAQEALQVPAQRGPVASYEVDEAGVPPGTSPAPWPRK